MYQDTRSKVPLSFNLMFDLRCAFHISYLTFFILKMPRTGTKRQTADVILYLPDGVRPIMLFFFQIFMLFLPPKNLARKGLICSHLVFFLVLFPTYAPFHSSYLCLK